jgi:hypothetical protein
VSLNSLSVTPLPGVQPTSQKAGTSWIMTISPKREAPDLLVPPWAVCLGKATTWQTWRSNMADIGMNGGGLKGQA